MTEQSHTPFGLPSDTGAKDLGVFLPIANGGWILSRNKPKIDGSYDYCRDAAVLAEKHGLDFAMAMAKYRGFGGETEHWDYQLDSYMTVAAIAEATKRVKVWGTVHTLLQNPGVVAKMTATLDQISHGRAGLNVVTGSYKDEFAQMGAWRDDVDHDQRYDLAYEWIQAIKALWTEDSVTKHGKYFTLEDCRSQPKPSTRPFIVCAGTSKKGMRFTAEETDAIFLSGGTPEELKKASEAAKEAAAEIGKTIRTYSMMTPVIGETDAEAEAFAQNIRDGFDEGALHGMMRAYGFLDSEIGKENDFTRKSRAGFMTPHVIGSPETVTEKLTELFEVSGTDGLMLIFPDYIKDIPIFAETVLPALRESFPGKAPVNG
ncbi:pyrimidine oxygenase [Altererythrobacter atlanticus]|uniref:Pyrimidine monooxygenase RutA n=1 Tax=Croceibacterium atlanticum TaxID=1267766 RepID=A0A0F7KQN5_9SPHN|nr:LLM class flavin-dependent oxidoreductase [Croceibacterium atlanticum]AKH41130.1 Pyrimidine monooxygenase RutA [Croceibacterium atlanticum]MBB5732646.1 pyrimidine oxygenase [Croceibacterium atlanticum]